MSKRYSDPAGPNNNSGPEHIRVRIQIRNAVTNDNLSVVFYLHAYMLRNLLEI
jgi:hypothetical protein